MRGAMLGFRSSKPGRAPCSDKLTWFNRQGQLTGPLSVQWILNRDRTGSRQQRTNTAGDPHILTALPSCSGPRSPQELKLARRENPGLGSGLSFTSHQLVALSKFLLSISPSSVWWW